MENLMGKVNGIEMAFVFENIHILYNKKRNILRERKLEKG